jgi:hypothetical protein
MKLGNTILFILALGLLSAYPATTFAQNNKDAVDQYRDLLISGSRTHPIDKIYVIHNKDGSQHIEMTSKQTPNVYNTPQPKPGQSGEEHMQRLQSAADKMFKDVQKLTGENGSPAPSPFVKQDSSFVKQDPSSFIRTSPKMVYRQPQYIPARWEPGRWESGRWIPPQYIPARWEPGGWVSSQ